MGGGGGVGGKVRIEHIHAFNWKCQNLRIGWDWREGGGYKTKLRERRTNEWKFILLVKWENYLLDRHNPCFSVRLLLWYDGSDGCDDNVNGNTCTLSFVSLSKSLNWMTDWLNSFESVIEKVCKWVCVCGCVKERERLRITLRIKCSMNKFAC